MTEPKEPVLYKQTRRSERIKLNSLAGINDRINKALSLRISEKIKFFKVF